MLKLFRKRRGVIVEIPPERRGQFPTHKTIADRAIKAKCKRLSRRKQLLKERNEHLSTYAYDIECDVYL